MGKGSSRCPLALLNAKQFSTGVSADRGPVRTTQPRPSPGHPPRLNILGQAARVSPEGWFQETVPSPSLAIPGKTL